MLLTDAASTAITLARLGNATSKEDMVQCGGLVIRLTHKPHAAYASSPGYDRSNIAWVSTLRENGLRQPSENIIQSVEINVDLGLYEGRH